MIQTGFRLAVLASMAALCAAQTPDCGVVAGWAAEGELRSYDEETLFEYMNGNSESYFNYGFVKMTTVTCRSGETTLVVDVSEMTDPESAYGIFTSNRDPRISVETIGTAAQVQARRGMLVKDKYFVELGADPDGDHTEKLRGFLTAMEKALPGGTERPEFLGWFPPENLEPNSIRMVPRSVLGIGILRRGYVAKYDFGQAFLVTSEETPEAAAAVMEAARVRMGTTGTAQLGEEAFQATDKYLGRMCFFRKGRYIAGVADVEESTDPAAAAAGLAARIP